MGMGAYDDDEHERREDQISLDDEETQEDYNTERYEGDVEFEYGEEENEEDEEVINEMLKNMRK